MQRIDAKCQASSYIATIAGYRFSTAAHADSHAGSAGVSLRW